VLPALAPRLELTEAENVNPPGGPITVGQLGPRAVLGRTVPGGGAGVAGGATSTKRLWALLGVGTGGVLEESMGTEYPWA